MSDRNDDAYLNMLSAMILHRREEDVYTKSMQINYMPKGLY